MFWQKYKLLVLAVAVLLIAGFGLKVVNRPNTTITVAPAAARVVLDGTKTIRSGGYRLSPGTHTLKATMAGFADTTKSFSVGSQGKTVVNVALDPNSQAGYDYLKNHPQEELAREKLGANSFKSNSTQITNTNPIIKVLPYIAADNSYRIDYGLGANNKSQVPIYITAINEGAADQARSWMSRQGYSSSIADAQVIIEPLLNQLPYETTDFSLQPDFTSGTDGEPKLTIDATITLSQSDTGDENTAVAQYKQEVFDYINSLGVNPGSYTINYNVQQP